MSGLGRKACSAVTSNVPGAGSPRRSTWPSAITGWRYCRGQSLLGQVHLLRGDTAAAVESTLQAFARACQVGDPCWEGISTRGLGLLAEHAGEPDRAFDLLTPPPRNGSTP